MLAWSTWSLAEDGSGPLQRWKSKTFDEKMDAVERGFEGWDNLTPAQQEAAMAQARNTFDKVSVEAKEAWAAMSQEEQDAAKQVAIDRSRRAAEEWQALPDDEQERRKGEIRDLIEERRSMRE